MNDTHTTLLTEAFNSLTVGSTADCVVDGVPIRIAHYEGRIVVGVWPWPKYPYGDYSQQVTPDDLCDSLTEPLTKPPPQKVRFVSTAPVQRMVARTQNFAALAAPWYALCEIQAQQHRESAAETGRVCAEIMATIPGSVYPSYKAIQRGEYRELCIPKLGTVEVYRSRVSIRKPIAVDVSKLSTLLEILR